MTTKFESSNSSITTPKYLINCDEKITDTNPTTSIWLNNLQALTTFNAVKALRISNQFNSIL